jgi:hypothetical protein
MYFYLLAPLYWLSNCSRASLPAAAGLINLASMLGILAVIGRRMGRCGLLWGAILLSLYVQFLGVGSLVSFWPADAQIMPLLLAVVLFAVAAAGQPWCLPAAAMAASLPAQTNVAHLPALGVVAAAALLLMVLQASAGWRRWRLPLLATLGVLALAWALPLVREITQPASDIAGMVSYFAGHGAGHAWGESLLVLAKELAALPLRCLAGRAGANWAVEQTLLVVAVAAAQAVLLPVAYRWARRTGRDFQAAVALLAMLLLAAMVVSVHRIVGPIFVHMTRWMTIAGVLALLVEGDMLWSWLESLPAVGRNPVWRRAGTVAAAALLAMVCMLNLKDAWREPARLRIEECDDDNGIEQLADDAQAALRAERARQCRLRIVDHDAWPTAAELAVRLTKAGFFVTVDPQWEMMFGPQHAAAKEPGGVLLVGSRQARQEPGGRLVGRTPKAMVVWKPAQ